jgi:leucyl-tRNA---protein transferase
MGLTAIPIRLGDTHDCGYLPERQARLGWVDPVVGVTPTVVDGLIEAGFRRSGSGIYRPFCRGCSSCIPVRIPVPGFTPNRSQRRTWSSNADLAVTIRPAEFEEEHYQLYLRYQQARHPGESMAAATRREYFDFLACPTLETWFVEFRHGSELLAVSIVDRLRDGLSAVYTFYEPRYPKRGLGTYAILYLVEEAKQLGLSWCYLGYWIPGSRKMGYKRLFRPLQARIGEHWQVLSETGEL